MTYLISYQKRWANDGTCYSQAIRITSEVYEHLLLALDAQKAIDAQNPMEDYERKMCLKSPLEKNNNIIFINLTQRDFFNRFLKAKLLDRNTCLIIK